MKTIIIKDLMVPLEEYATVPEGATLYDAILALEKAQEAFDLSQHKHRAILVLDKGKKVVGKITMFDVLIALEPKYEKLDDVGGYSPDFIKSILKDNIFWKEPLQHICNQAPNLNVRDFMKAPTGDMYIDENAALGDAISQLIVSRYHSLLVTRDKSVVGILRLSDVFSQISAKIKNCEV